MTEKTTNVDLMGPDAVDIILAHSKHRCPNHCHKCPDLIAIVKARGGDYTDEEEIIMPGCWGGSMHRSLDACYCESKVMREWRKEEREKRLFQMKRLITAFPDEAERILLALREAE